MGVFNHGRALALAAAGLACGFILDTHPALAHPSGPLCPITPPPSGRLHSLLTSLGRSYDSDVIFINRGAERRSIEIYYFRSTASPGRAIKGALKSTRVISTYSFTSAVEERGDLSLYFDSFCTTLPEGSITGDDNGNIEIKNATKSPIEANFVLVQSADDYNFDSDGKKDIRAKDVTTAQGDCPATKIDIDFKAWPFPPAADDRKADQDTTTKKYRKLHFTMPPIYPATSKCFEYIPSVYDGDGLKHDIDPQIINH